MALKITKAVDAVEREYHGVTLIIARGNNRAFRDKFAALRRGEAVKTGSRNRGRAGGDDFSDMKAEKQDKLLAEAYAGTVLVGWRGFSDGGKDVPFTEENASDLLFNDDMLREFVVTEANALEEFIAEEKQDVLKKSPPPTAGS